MWRESLSRGFDSRRPKTEGPKILRLCLVSCQQRQYSACTHSWEEGGTVFRSTDRTLHQKATRREQVRCVRQSGRRSRADSNFLWRQGSANQGTQGRLFPPPLDCTTTPVTVPSL